mgnify:CR=1 FL=1
MTYSLLKQVIALINTLWSRISIDYVDINKLALFVEYD